MYSEIEKNTFSQLLFVFLIAPVITLSYTHICLYIYYKSCVICQIVYSWDSVPCQKQIPITHLTCLFTFFFSLLISKLPLPSSSSLPYFHLGYCSRLFNWPLCLQHFLFSYCFQNNIPKLVLNFHIPVKNLSDSPVFVESSLDIGYGKCLSSSPPCSL